MDKAALKEQVIATLKEVHDPEIPVDIYELGLIYDIIIQDDMSVDITMTLTTPACPVAESLPGEVKEKVKGIDGIADARVDLVWEPSWHQDMMSEAAKLEMGLF